MWVLAGVFIVFFGGIAWLAYVENKPSKEKEKLENSPTHKIVIGIAIVIGIIFVLGTLTEAFG